jgi:Protein of unknown function (DUF3025)
MPTMPAMPTALPPIDWQRPWLEPYRALAEPLLAAARGSASVAEVLSLAAPAAVRFVPQDALSKGMAYEAFVFDQGAVPTRDNLHDFFNGLSWLAFPRTKQRLNQLQAAQIAQGAGTGEAVARRGPVRDALTLFDENAALLMAPDAVWEALLRKNWQLLFIEQRALWKQCTLLLFGHALLEKLVHPRKAITAHVYRLGANLPALACIDAWLAGDLQADRLAAKPFAPLPVLGVPGWWPENENVSFYDDSQVFRRPGQHPQ